MNVATAIDGPAMSYQIHFHAAGMGFVSFQSANVRILIRRCGSGTILDPSAIACAIVPQCALNSTLKSAKHYTAKNSQGRARQRDTTDVTAGSQSHRDIRQLVSAN
ncbi:hypothetical protein N2601_30835 (plasmid) [Rhizobium sp. CB3060]|uniref:hypothetical protein n=1 Tax=Rhizobium sp. CB3060 TaxID=3138255 RepID=UPI0021A8670D|nr:hypothetical protein [Rhizobium tropici]UWU25818.1 hypothetical protein N2601_30835 [Rhizobium tropici]